jgi:uncharacterized membrane protein YdjX (TVP38/TMEM64 family)
MTSIDSACESESEDPTATERPCRKVPGRLRPYWRVSLLALMLVVSGLILINRAWLHQFESYGYPGIFVTHLIGSATIILPAPSITLTFAMGSALNPVWVGLASAAGASLGELTGFIAGYGGSAVIERFDLYNRVRGYVERYGLIPVFILAMIPNPFFDLAGIAAGALRFPVWQFVSAVFLGNAVKMILVAYAGAGSVRLLDRWF